jgi:hypothetical protein
VSRPAIPPNPESTPDSWAIAGQASRLGIELAGRIAAEFGRLVPVAAPSDVRQDPGRALRAAQVQLERTVSGVIEALAETIDAYADLASRAGDSHRHVPGLETVTDSTRPAESGAVVLWIHNTTDADSGELILRPTAMLDGDGRVLDAQVDIDDAPNVRVAAGASHAVTLTVSPAPDAAPGRYHGMVLVGGVPDALVHLAVDVIAVDVMAVDVEADEP